MSWVKLDDGIADHPKMLAAGPLACWLWTCGLAYCNRQARRDGFIPAEKVRCLFPMPQPMKQAERLVSVGLWDTVAGGYLVHDYHEYQPTPERAAAISAARAAAGRRGGAASGAARRDGNGAATAKQFASGVASGGEANALRSNEANANPVPVPVPVPVVSTESLPRSEEEEGGAAAGRWPADAGPSALMALWNAVAQEAGLPKAAELTPQRRRAAARRLRARPLAAWGVIYARIGASRFCRGTNDRGWRADFDFALRPDTATRVLEGRYDNRPLAPKRLSAAGEQTVANLQSWVDKGGRTA